MERTVTVSYTHLDVYKRQGRECPLFIAQQLLVLLRMVRRTRHDSCATRLDTAVVSADDAPLLLFRYLEVLLLHTACAGMPRYPQRPRQ